MDPNLFKGNLDLILLSVLEREAGYGQDIAKRVDALTGGEIRLNAGSLYPALHRLEVSGLLGTQFGEAGRNGKPRKYYAITDAGREVLKAKRAEFQTFTGAVQRLSGS